MRKVVCVICRAIFKVTEDPPAELVDAGGVDEHGQPVDPYRSSELKLKDSIDAVDYCQRTCPFCRLGSPWSSEFQQQ